VRSVLRSPEVIVRTWRAARQSLDGLQERDVRGALHRLDPLWDQLFPAEQARSSSCDVAPDGADIRMRTEGLTKLVADLGAIKPESRRAA
jgi:site-specific DNA recombinase